MQRVGTTMIALVGERARELARVVGGDPNARAVLPDGDDEALDRAVAVWREAWHTHAPFLLHDADPLTDVADAWVGYYEETAPRGHLEVTVSAVLERWRAGSVDLPDLYLIVDAHALDATRRHFWLGLMHEAAPSRVLPVAGEAGAVRDAVAHWRAGRWWPDLDRLLERAGHVVPDRVGLG